MAETRKQIAFDLDTKALETYYPSESWNNAYEVIKRHMLKNHLGKLAVVPPSYMADQPFLT